MKILFHQLEIGDKFHNGFDKDGSGMVYEKYSKSLGLCVEVHGKTASRLVGGKFSFGAFATVWKIDS